ncbi:MAG TPA: hypothetical protein VLH40_08735 [Atribacteraceae bacterium]|nr:hypothetical protein [Atribacteraceae bacterium]
MEAKSGLEKHSVAVFFEGLAEIAFRIHHDGTRPGGGLTERLSGDQQKAERPFPVRIKTVLPLL